MPDTGIVRALYVNRWASQSAKKMRALIEIADKTEINALVIDMKDEFGLNFESKDTIVSRNAGRAGRAQASLAAARHAQGASHPRDRAGRGVQGFRRRTGESAARIRKPDGTPWHDKKGMTWVNPYDPDLRIQHSRRRGAARLGFDEIQFDYIRFPEPYESLPPQVFQDANGVPKPQALADFFRAACPRIQAQGARCTADIFGW